MLACIRAAAILLLGTTVCVAAPAPKISPSDLPGRERERFIDRPGFREVAPRPPLVVPETGVKPKGKRKCRALKSGKRKAC
jgi:hypothetical protein